MSKGSGERAVPLIPLEQAIVPFYDQEIIAVRLPDGRIAAVLASMCGVLQLITRGQARRITADPVIVDYLLPCIVQTAGGPQDLDVLVAWAIPRWLTGIRLGMVAPAKRPGIEAFQREAADALYRYFLQPRMLPDTTANGIVPALPEFGVVTTDIVETQPVAVNAEQVIQLTEQIASLSAVVNLLREHLAGLLDLHGHVDDLSHQVRDALTLLQALAGRQDAQDEQIAQIDERTQRLTPAHTRDVKEFIDRMVRDTKNLDAPLTYIVIYGRLKHRFRVATYKEIADDHFAGVLAFLQEEVRRALGGEAPAQGMLF
ncbi:MAG TPA: phage antirepressor N-terminal domain-containing protein [Ktedonobacterales bacterium]|nr:phage antirepressor N-terminal domain-containing protein [Ktedonobacterales bacterium]